MFVSPQSPRLATEPDAKGVVAHDQLDTLREVDRLLERAGLEIVVFRRAHNGASFYFAILERE